MKTWSTSHIPCRYPVPEPTATATIGGSKKEETIVTDWRELFHSKEEVLNAPPISFLIDGFLQPYSVKMLPALPRLCVSGKASSQSTWFTRS
jgi:hypothetical protein